MDDISDNDLANMNDDEMAQYVEDVSSGYMFDPDNEILEKDKRMSFIAFFESIKKEVDELQFAPMNECAKVVSRYSRLLEWVKTKIYAIDAKFTAEYERRMKKCL